MKNIFIFLAFTFSLQAQDFNITNFGAKSGDGIDNTKAVQKTIDQASKVNGKVIFPSGKFATGTIHLKSNVTIILSRGAIWTEVPELEKFEKYRASVRSRMDKYAQTNFILAMDAENITIDGEGTIDGNGRRAEIEAIRHNELKTMRPWGLHFINCRNIKIRNIRMINSSYWMQRYFNCDKLLIEGITVFNHGTTNSDGMDIDGCHDVRIANCDIDASDDGICFKSEGLRACENAVITNCIVRSHATAIKFGTGSMGGFKRIAISNCIIRPSKSKEMVHDANCWRGLAGIEIQSVDGGIVEDFVISNLIIDSSETPIHIKLGNRFDRNWEGGGKAEKGILRNISFNNIIVRNAGPISSAVTGYPGNYIENIVFSNFNYEAEGLGKSTDTVMKVNENSNAYPMNRMYGSNLPSYGLFLRHVKGVYLNNVQFKTIGPDQRSAIVLDDVNSGKIEILKGENKSSSQALVKLKDARNISFTGDGGINDLQQYVNITDDSSQNIFFHNMRFRELNHPITLKKLVAQPLCKNVSYVHLNWSEGIANGSGVFEYKILRDGLLVSTTRKLSFDDYNITENTKYKYEVIAYNAEGIEDIRKNAEIITVADNEKPTMKSWRLIDNQTFELIFSEPLNFKSSVDQSFFISSPSVVISSINLQNKGEVIILKVASIQPEVPYVLQIKNLKDNSKKGNMIDPVSIQFTDRPLVAQWSFDDGNTEGIKDKGFLPEKNKSLQIANAPSLNFSENMAISLWFKLNDPTQEKYYRLLSKRKTWNEKAGYELEINPGQNRINFCGGAVSTDFQGVVTYSFDKEWHHLVAMIKDQKAVFYIDGKLIGEDGLVANPVPNSTDLFIGCNPSGGDVFEGTIDELKIFNRALSENEINDLSKR